MGSADFEYLRIREQQERDAAERATSPEAQRSHEELAERYRAMQVEQANQPRPEGRAELHYLWQLGVRTG